MRWIDKPSVGVLALMFPLMVGSVFLILLGFLMPHGRFFADDFAVYASTVDHGGVLEACSHWLTTWTGRWAERLGSCFFFNWRFEDGHSFVGSLACIGVLFCGCFFLMNRWSDARAGIIMPFTFLPVAYFAVLYPGESWYSPMAGQIYLVSLGLSLLALSTLGRADWKSRAIAIACMVIVPGYFEGASVWLIASWVLWIAYRLYQNQSIRFDLLVLAIGVVALASTIALPGNWGRLGAGEATREQPMLDAAYHTLRAPTVVLRQAPLWFLLVALIGLSSSLSGSFEGLKRVRWGILIVLLLGMAAYAMPPAMVLGRYPPPRTVVPIAVLAALAVFFAATLLGDLEHMRARHVQRLIRLSLVGLSCWLVWKQIDYIRVQAPVAFEYAKSFDARHAELKSLGHVDVVVPPLASSGVFHDANPTADVDHWINRSMASSYGLKSIRLDRSLPVDAPIQVIADPSPSTLSVDRDQTANPRQ